MIGAIFRDIHIWSATGETGGSGSGYYSAMSGNGSDPGQPLATLRSHVGVLSNFFVGRGDQVVDRGLTSSTILGTRGANWDISDQERLHCKLTW